MLHFFLYFFLFGYTFARPLCVCVYFMLCWAVLCSVDLTVKLINNAFEAIFLPPALFWLRLLFIFFFPDCILYIARVYVRLMYITACIVYNIDQARALPYILVLLILFHVAVIIWNCQWISAPINQWNRFEYNAFWLISTIILFC